MRIIFLLSLLISNISFSQVTNKTLTKEEFEQKRWERIHSLINEEISVINKVRKKSQKLMYRLFELKSEKIKLFKGKENKEFLAKKRKHGRKVKRKDVFKKTLKLFNEANTYGHNLLRRFPKSRYKAAIYYTLALNTRDFSYNKNELIYLRKAIKHSKYDKNIRYLATTSLAEYYYNKKNYKSAIYNYEKIIDNKEDEWLTKNLYNYGWCLLKTKKFNASINRLEESFQLSADEFYVDVRDQVMTSLVSFYVYGKEIQRGIKFIQKHATQKQESLLKLAKKSSAKGFFKETEQIVQMLESAIDPLKEFELYTDLRLFQFDIYKQYHKPKKLLKIANMFPALKFTEYQQEDAIQKISEVVGAKQVILKKDYSKHDQDYDKNILSQIIDYFNILSTIHIEEKPHYEYFKAETYYSVGQFDKALQSYKISLIDYDKKPSKEDLRLKNVDAIFSCIELLDLKKDKKSKELDFAYNKYLGYWPKSEKANSIYPRLFSLYLDRQDFKLSQKTIDRYISYFPKQLKKQQSLYRLQLDIFIKTKNTKLLSDKINLIRTGYLNFPKNEIKKSETILANILFNSFKKINIAGDSKGALKGYQKVHFTGHYPASIKAEAAFNMAMIFTDLEDNNNAIKWYKKSFKFYTKKEKKEKRLFLEKMALRTELLHNFRSSAHLNSFILSSFCSDKKKNIKVFSNAIRADLASDYIMKSFITIRKYSKCISIFPKSLKKEILVHLFENKHESKMNSFIDDFKLKNIFSSKISFYYERLFWKYYGDNKSKQQTYYLRIKKLNNEKSKLMISSLKLLKRFVKTSDIFLIKVIKIKKPLDPNRFSQKLQGRLASLGPVIKQADDILKMGHGQVSVLVYDQLTRLTNQFGNEISKYSLPIPDKDFQKQFSSQMNMLANNIYSQRNKFKNDSQNLIEKNELLIVRRQESHLAADILSVSDIRPQASKMAITFDLGK
jgi:hypothetical protein